MAISVRCKSCRADYKLTHKKCPKCLATSPPSKDRVYKVRVKFHGNKWRTKVVHSLLEAKAIEIEFMTEAKELAKDKSRMRSADCTLNDLNDSFLEWSKLNCSSWKDDKSRYGNHIEPYLGKKRASDIKLIDLEKLKSHLQSTGLSPQTVKHVLALVRRIYNFGIDRGLYKGNNPCSRLKMPKFDNQVSNPLCEEGQQRLRQTLETWQNQRAALVVQYAMLTGRRRGEILRLTWDRVDLEQGIVTYHGTTTKSGKTQALPVSAKALEVLNQALALNSNQKEGLVFPTSTGRYYSGFYVIWRRIRKAANIDIRFHDLRHTYASIVASSGKVQMHVLQELLGHSDIKMTKRYSHLFDHALRAAVEVAV